MIAYMALSLAGHDKNRLYMIMDETDTTVLLCDGKIRPIQKMKWKKKKHIQLIKKIMNENLAERIRKQETVRDEEIKLALKQYQNRITMRDHTKIEGKE